MIHNPTQRLFRNPVKRARLIALLLLAAIAWGSTAELTHQHSAKGKPKGSSAAAQPSLPVATSFDQVSDGTTKGTSSNTKGGADCLICQLHQNLSATAINHEPGNGPAETRGPHSTLTAVVQLSEFTATGHGRAPPVLL